MSDERDGEIKEILERLFLLNLDANFRLIKSDFTHALNLIKEYTKVTGATCMLVEAGYSVMVRLAERSDIQQKVLCLEILCKVLRNAASEQIERLIFEEDYPIQDEKASHEQKLNRLFKVAIRACFAGRTGKKETMEL